jgi:plastocyanin
MKVRFFASAACLAGMALFLVSCGKKEETAENAPASAAQPAATPIDMATVGSVTGGVKFDGVAPKPKKINMASEPACAAAHPGGVVDPEVVVDAKNNLANVIVYVKEGLGDRAFDTPKQAAELDQQGCMYVPHIVAVMTGQSITVKNADQTTHNIHPSPKNNREWNKSQAAGAPDITDVFAREEVAIPVKCNVHPWMKSYIAVFKHPYFAVSGADGSFTIKDLPPGTYTLEAWHEKYGTSDQTVTIGAKEAKTVTFTFKPAA